MYIFDLQIPTKTALNVFSNIILFKMDVIEKLILFSTIFALMLRNTCPYNICKFKKIMYKKMLYNKLFFEIKIKSKSQINYYSYILNQGLILYQYSERLFKCFTRFDSTLHKKYKKCVRMEPSPRINNPIVNSSQHQQHLIDISYNCRLAFLRSFA